MVNKARLARELAERGLTSFRCHCWPRAFPHKYPTHCENVEVAPSQTWCVLCANSTRRFRYHGRICDGCGNQVPMASSTQGAIERRAKEIFTGTEEQFKAFVEAASRCLACDGEKEMDFYNTYCEDCDRAVHVREYNARLADFVWRVKFILRRDAVQGCVDQWVSFVRRRYSQRFEDWLVQKLTLRKTERTKSSVLALAKIDPRFDQRCSRRYHGCTCTLGSVNNQKSEKDILSQEEAECTMFDQAVSEWDDQEWDSMSHEDRENTWIWLFTSGLMSPTIANAKHVASQVVWGREELDFDIRDHRVFEEVESDDSVEFIGGRAVSHMGPLFPSRRKRGSRGGRKTKWKRDGYCYSTLVARSERADLCDKLGPKPTIGEFLDMAADCAVTSLPKRAILVSDIGMHIRPDKDWPMMEQMEYLSLNKDHYRLGAEVWEEREDEQYAEWFCQHVMPIVQKEEERKEIDQWAKCVEQAQLVPVEEETIEEDRCVRGKGDCWRQIHVLRLKFPKERTDVTAREVYNALVEYDEKLRTRPNKTALDRKNPNWFMESNAGAWTVEEDGDLHVSFGEYVMTEHGLQTHCPGALTIQEALAFIRLNMTKVTKRPVIHELADGSILADQEETIEDALVSKAGQASADLAMRSLNNPTVSMNLQNTVSAKVTDALTRVNKICPWAIPPENQHHASNLHIPWSETNGDQHDHPIHAAIRRIQCYEELPKHIRSDYTTVSMAEGNWRQIESGLKALGRTYAGSHQNPVIDIKDHGRYAGTGSVTKSVFTLDEVTTPTVIFHDSGHFMSAGFLWDFFRKNPKVMHVYVTHVFPLVSLLVDTSPDPTLYQFTFSGDGSTLIYIPEGHCGGKYEQPADPGILLAKSISDVEGLLTIYGAVIDSRLNSHVQCWSRFYVAVPSFVALNMPDMMPLRRLKRAMPGKLPLIKTEYYTKLFQYAKTLPMKEADAWGKMRQFTVDQHMYFPVGVQAMLIDSVMEAVKIPVIPDLQSKYYGSVGEMLKYKTVGHVIRLKHKLFDARYAKRAMNLINEPEVLHLLPTVEIVLKELTGHQYGISWVVPKAERQRFWTVMKTWFGRWYGKRTDDETSLINHDGYVLWDHCISLTSRTEQSIGVDIVKETQRRAYRAIYEDDVWKRPKQLPTVPPPLRFPRWQEDEGSTIVGSDVTTEATDDIFDRYGSGSSMTDEEDNDPKEHWKSETGCCDSCPLYDVWKMTYPALTIEDYNEATRASHRVNRTRSVKDDETEHTRTQMLLLIKRAMDRRNRENLKKNPKIGMETPMDTIVEEREAPIEPPDVTQAKEFIREALRDPGVIEPVPQKRYQPRPFDKAKAEEDWDKIQQERKKIPYHPSGRGVALWDDLFPKTVDKRVHAVPFEKPLFYPQIIYPRGDCLLVTLHQLMGLNPCTILLVASRAIEEIDTKGNILGTGILDTVGCHYLCNFKVYDKQRNLLAEHGVKEGPTFKIQWESNPDHFSPIGVESKQMLIREPIVSRNAPQGLSELLSELSSLPSINWTDWKPSGTRGGQFVRAMIERTTGTLAGVEINMESLKSWENMCDGLKQNQPERFLSVVVGSPGCRKSSAIQRVLAKKKYQRDNLFAVAMATNTLAIDWRDKLGVRDKDPRTNRATPGRYVSTYERCIADGNWGWVMVFDEDKYPKGYIDLVAALFPHVRHFIFLCDPYQTTWHEPNPQCHLNSPDILGNAPFLFPHASTYYFGTWRLPAGIANFFRLPTFNGGLGSIHFANSSLSTWRDLVPFLGHRYDEIGLQNLWKRKMLFVASHAAKQWVDALGEVDSATFAGSQGLSVELAIVEIDHRVLRMVDPKMLFTVMTRASELIIVCNFAMDGVTRRSIADNPVLDMLFKYRENYAEGSVVKIHPDWTVDMFKLCGELPSSLKPVLAGPPQKLKNGDFVKRFYPESWFSEYIDPDSIKLRGGARLDPMGEIYRDAHDFKPFIINHQWVPVVEAEVPRFGIRERKVPTHLPPIHEEELVEANQSMVLERYEAELSYKGIFSRQLPDIPIPYWNSGARRQKYIKERREAMKGWSRSLKDVTIARELQAGMANDHTHFMPKALNWGLDQRSDDGPSFGAGVAQRIRRMSLLENQREVQEGVPYGKAMFEALSHYMQWSSSYAWDQTLYEDCEILFQMRRAERSDELKKMSLNRASPDYVDFLTAKTQWKLKARVSKPASPLQTILVRSDRVLFRDGPLGIYLLEMIERHCPKYVYLHARKTFEQMGEWIRDQPQPPVFEMCDIEGFDSSIRGADVTLETCIMSMFNVPQDHIDAYTDDKMDFHTRTMHFGIMRFSGEIFTWLFNTLHTLARECLKYEHQPGDPIAVSGDDILKWIVRRESAVWRRWEASDPSVEKRYQDKRGEFCSFIVYKGVIFKDPVILYRRLKGQIERGRVDEVALGYFEMFAVGYRLADQLYDLMDENELQYCAAINRIMFNWRKVTGSNVVLPWSKVHVDYTDMSGGSREEAVVLLEEYFGDTDPRELSPISASDILSTSLPGVSFQHLWQDYSLDD